MTEQLEHELRELFAEDADRAPAAAGLVELAVRRARRRRSARIAWAAAAVAAAAVAPIAVVGVDGLPGGGAADSPTVSRPVVSGKGPLPDGAVASCVEQYSPGAVTGRAFAFDGTVTDIAPARSSDGLEVAAVTFSVNEWFAGGSGTSVTVDMTPPDAGRTVTDSTPAYSVGTRLLVSGEPRWGGTPLEEAIGWGCGFTRYYDEATASRWRAAFG